MALADAVPFAVAAWNLDEVSGNRADQVGSSTLVDAMSIASTTGMFGNAVDFNSQYMTCADNAAISPGDVAFCIRFWVKFTTFSSTRTVLAKGADLGDASTCNWGVYADGAGNLNFRVSNGVLFTNAIYGTTLSTGVWYLVHAWHDPGADQIGIVANAGTAVTSSFLTGLVDGSGALTVGDDGSSGRRLVGQLDDLVFLTGYILDATERTADYNSGAGVAFADWGGGGPPPASNTGFLALLM